MVVLPALLEPKASRTRSLWTTAEACRSVHPSRSRVARIISRAIRAAASASGSAERPAMVTCPPSCSER